MDIQPNELGLNKSNAIPASKSRSVRKKVLIANSLPKKSQDRIHQSIKKYISTIQVAEKRQCNEADTSNIINDMLGDLFGYDKFFDVTSEYRIRGQFADYGVKQDGKVIFFIEVKSVSINLNENHLFQVTSYAVNEGVEWVVLTNGRVWQLYHIGFGQPIQRDLVLSVDLLDDKLSPREKADLLVYLSKESFKKRVPGSLWSQKVALSAPNIIKILLSEDSIRRLRLQLKKKTGYNAPDAEIRKLVESLLSAS